MPHLKLFWNILWFMETLNGKKKIEKKVIIILMINISVKDGLHMRVFFTETAILIGHKSCPRVFFWCIGQTAEAEFC